MFAVGKLFPQACLFKAHAMIVMADACYNFAFLQRASYLFSIQTPGYWSAGCVHPCFDSDKPLIDLHRKGFYAIHVLVFTVQAFVGTVDDTPFILYSCMVYLVPAVVAVIVAFCRNPVTRPNGIFPGLTQAMFYCGALELCACLFDADAFIKSFFFSVFMGSVTILILHMDGHMFHRTVSCFGHGQGWFAARGFLLHRVGVVTALLLALLLQPILHDTLVGGSVCLSNEAEWAVIVDMHHNDTCHPILQDINGRCVLVDILDGDNCGEVSGCAPKRSQIIKNVTADMTKDQHKVFLEEVDKRANMCSSGKAYFNRVDFHTRTLYRVLKSFGGMADTCKGRPKASDVNIPTQMYGDGNTKDLFWGTKIPILDEDSSQGVGGKIVGFVSSRLFGYLRTNFFNPLKDVHVQFEDEDKSYDGIFYLASGMALKPMQVYTWQNMTSDESISHFCFAGLAAHEMRRVITGLPPQSGGVPQELSSMGIVFASKWSWLGREFKVRPTFEHYGADAYFNEQGDLVAMYWAHKDRFLFKGDTDWDHVKWVLKCTVFAAVTLKHHLVEVHFTTSNFMTYSSTKNLDPDHPVRRLLKPHTYGAVSINYGAVSTLATEFSVLHRASAFTWDALQAAFRASYEGGTYHPLRNFRAERNMIDVKDDLWPIGQDLEEFRAVVHKYVTSYFDVYYQTDESLRSDDQMIEFWEGLRDHDNHPSRDTFPHMDSKSVAVEVLSDMIVTVTGMHTHVGNVADYLADPTFVSSKIRPHKEIADVQAAFQGMNIGLMTAILQPKLLGDFKHLILKDERRARTETIFDEFQIDLRKLSERVKERNLKRTWPSNSFNPKYMLSSVSS